MIRRLLLFAALVLGVRCTARASTPAS